MLLRFLAVLALATASLAQSRVLSVEEGAPIGTLVGDLGASGPFLIVSPDKAEDHFVVNQNSGEIRTRTLLDREAKDTFTLSAIPAQGDTIQVTIQVLDVNDNAPDFGQGEFKIDIPENIPPGTRRKLPSAIDLDASGVEAYHIVSGNVGEAFDVDFDRAKDSLDLVVKGSLDREKLEKYSMVLVASDDGQPPRSASMTLTVQVQDLNDSPPIFSKQRYFTTIAENLPVGSSVLQVYASDADDDVNSKITYSINRRQSDKEALFNIDASNGLLTVNKALSFERQSVHEIVVVAKDGGEVPQETSAFITVRLTAASPYSRSPIVPNSNDLPKLKIEYDDDGKQVSEFAQVGRDFATLIGINDFSLDKEDKVEISGNVFTVNKKGSQFKLVVKQQLDYESQSTYYVTIKVSKPDGSVFEVPLTIDISDGNEHAPKFDKETYAVSLSESLAIGSSILTAKATDGDNGKTGQISYSLRYGDSSSTTFADWFSIDEESGLITTQSKLDCELESNPKVIIVASDHGDPVKTATATFSASISDVNDHKPIFSQTFYDMELSEDSPKGKCFLTLEATDGDCGENALVSYALKEPSDYFKVNEKNGELCIARQLDYEKQSTHTLIVHAKDKGGLSSSTLVNIAITDVNDNAPEIMPTVYVAKIAKSLDLNVPILTVIASDKDEDMQGRLTYAFVSGNEEGAFVIESTSGIIYLAKKQPGQKTYRLTVSATDSQGVKSSSDASVLIQVVEDGNILFSKYQYEFNVPEDISPYSEVGRISSNERGFKFTLTEQSVSGYFSLDTGTGRIRTESRLDHESHPFVVLNVMAENSLGDSYNVQALFTISDVNDNAPEFPFSSVSTTVPEDFPTSGVLYTCLAKDNDSGDNGKITYKLLSGSPEFLIDPVTGEIKLSTPLDFEKNPDHQIIIEAEDTGLPRLKSTMKLTIFVQDINDNAPAFDKVRYEVSLPENQLQGTPVLTINAQDKDSGKNGRITYTISPNPYLSILPNSGVLIFNGQLNKEINPTLELTVTATDNGVPARKASAPVKVNISDKTDTTPKFHRPKYLFRTIENLPKGTLVGSVEATVNDDENSIEYRFRTPSTKFEIGHNTGEIKILERLDREEMDSYELLVEALDQNSSLRKSAQTLVKITVDDVNDEPPKLEAPANRMVYVSKTVNSPSLVVATIKATDKDKNDALTYSISGGENALIIDKWTGELKLTSKEAAALRSSNMTITVKISDSAKPVPNSLTEDISIFFIDETSNELLSKITQTINVSKDVNLGSIVGNINSALSTTIERKVFISQAKSRQHFPFLINAATGEVVTISLLNSTTNGHFECEVVVQDMSGAIPPIHVQVVIKVSEENQSERPHFEENPIKISVPEGLQLGEVVYTMSPITSNPLRQLTFTLLEQLPHEVFVIEDGTGRIMLSKVLDYEKDPSYIVTVRVTEKRSQLSSFVTLIVSVQDTNDNEPQILSSGELRLPSDPLLNSPIMRIIATDKDFGENGKLEFSIVSGNDDGAFLLNAHSGDLFLMKPALKDYYLRIRAQDFGTPRHFSDKELHVIATQNKLGQPKFAQSTMILNVQENLPPGTPVSALKTLNGDSISLDYELLVGGDKFSIEQSSGQLKTLAELDREEQQSYSLVVSVSDQRYPDQSDTAIVNVYIEDVNDNDPTFGATCRDLKIPENAMEQYIHTFIAFDEDAGDNGQVTYKLTNSQTTFMLNADSGQLTAPPLDRESKGKFELEIIAEDHGTGQVRSASCTITVTVLDENDNEPSFTQSIYSASVKEDVPLGTEVLKVHATDSDLGDNAAIEYSIENATFSAFAIDKDSGAISTTDILDRETIDEYTFTVLAVDGGKGLVKSSRAVVTILITDANDHAPQFAEFPFKINITATPPVGAPLLRLSANDPDLGAHSQLTFNLVRPEQRALFDLSANEGILTIQKSDISWEPGTVQTLEVSVSDAGSPPRSSTGLVEVSIEGGPAITLTFQQNTYHSELAENPASGEDVAKVHAVRSDGRRQRVIYTFLRGNEDGGFEINSNNGLIRVRDPEVIDFEKHRQFILTIQAQGLGEESDLNAYTTCIITIKDRNDNAPTFTQAIYRARVIEGLSKNSLITTVAAFDMDYEQSGDITYEIVGGNVDEAFYMGTAQPGVILTNTVLDREVRDSYELTIAAKDNGSPPLLGSCQVIIRVIDSNDSPLQFPAFPPFRIAQDLPAGSLIATIRAHDIDLQSDVAYSIKDGADSDKVALTTFTGQMYLQKSPLAWSENEINVEVEAFDGKFKASQSVKIFYDRGGKDCHPKFEQSLYRFQLSSNATFPTSIGDIAAISCGSNDNLMYSMLSSGVVSVVANNGTLVVNQALLSNSSKFIVQVQDRRSKQSSTAVVVVETRAILEEPLEFDLPTDTFEIGGSLKVFKANLKSIPAEPVVFNISRNAFVTIDSSTGDVYRLSNIESSSGNENAVLSVRRMSDDASSGIKKTVRFFLPPSQLRSAAAKTKEKKVELSILSPLSTKVSICDVEAPSIAQILSGNDDNLFTLDTTKQFLVLTKLPQAAVKTTLVVRMGGLSEITICSVSVTFKEAIESDHEENQANKIFPIDTFVTSVPEDSLVGTSFFEIPVGSLSNDLSFWSESSVFEVNPMAPVISVNAPLDFESEPTHNIVIFAKEQVTNKQFSCNIQIMIESVDEFQPVFSQDVYTFNIPNNAGPGYQLGSVRANDADSGPDGFVSYSVSPLNPYFDVDHKTGAVSLRRQLDTGVLKQTVRRRRSLQEIQMTVVSKSLKPDSLSSSAKIVLYLEDALLPIAASTESDSGVAPWIQGVLVGLALILGLLAFGAVYHCRKVRDAKQAQKIALLPSPPSGGIVNTSSSTYSGDQTLEMVGVGSRYPPQYSEIMSDFDRANSSTVTSKPVTRSELSEKSHRSASSGRGSVEDCDEDADVEIRMINEGNWNIPCSTSQMSGSHHYEGDDRISQGSVQNTEEYLARLGIDIRKPPNVKIQMSEDPYSRAGGAGSIYNRIGDDAMSEHNSTISAKPHSLLYGSTGRQLSMTGSLSSIVHSEEELAGSYNWDYLLDWCPQYQNLAHVFKEISKLKDDDPGDAQNKRVLNAFANIKNPSIGRNRLIPVRSTQSPIAQDMLSQNALSPSFHPSLSPLATKSPSVSPMSVPLKRDIGPPRIGRGPLQ